MPVPGEPRVSPGRDLQLPNTQWGRIHPPASLYPSPVSLHGGQCQLPVANATPEQQRCGSRAQGPCAALKGAGHGDLGGLLPDALTPGTRQLAGGQAACGLPVPILLWRRPLGAAEGCEAWDPHPGLQPQWGFCPAGLQPQGGGQEGAGARRVSSFLPQPPPPLVCFNCILFLSLLLLFCNFLFCSYSSFLFSKLGGFSF